MSSVDFSAKSLTVGSLNGVPFDDIITLHTNQSFDYMRVDGVVHVGEPLKVKRVFTYGINDKSLFDLALERENSVMVRNNLNYFFEFTRIYLKFLPRHTRTM